MDSPELPSRIIVMLLMGFFGCGCTSAREERRAEPAHSRPEPSKTTSDRRRAPAPESSPRVGMLEEYRVKAESLTLRSNHLPEAAAVVALPSEYKAGETRRWPLVIAFGGAGECAKPPPLGALAWLKFYEADRAMIALEKGKLGQGDFRGLVTPVRLREFNDRLRRAPYRGVILACPSSPLLSSLPLESPDYEAFLMEELMPVLEERYRPSAIGIDGVSMGGARSMYYGLKHPEVFASIGAIQGAFGRHLAVYRELIERNGTLLRERPIQLVTSDGDGLAPVVRMMRSLLDENDIESRFLDLRGPHDYVFNQGPGVISLLMFHDEVLQSLPVQAGAAPPPQEMRANGDP